VAHYQHAAFLIDMHTCFAAAHLGHTTVFREHQSRKVEEER
jgi:hypothetical protein